MSGGFSRSISSPDEIREDARLKAILQLTDPKNNPLLTQWSAKQINARAKVLYMQAKLLELYHVNVDYKKLVDNMETGMIAHERKGRTGYEEVTKQMREEAEKKERSASERLGL